jgi:hypothetical protein
MPASRFYATVCGLSPNHSASLHHPAELPACRSFAAAPFALVPDGHLYARVLASLPVTSLVGLTNYIRMYLVKAGLATAEAARDDLRDSTCLQHFLQRADSVIVLAVIACMQSYLT